MGALGGKRGAGRSAGGRNGPGRLVQGARSKGVRASRAGCRAKAAFGAWEGGRIPLKKGEDFEQKVSTGGKRAESGAGCKKPEPELSDEETAEIRQRYSKPDPKTAAQYKRAKNEAEAASKRKWRKLFDAYQRCRELEKEHELTTELSSTMLKSYLTEAALKKMWAEADKIPAFRELDDALTEFSEN